MLKTFKQRYWQPPRAHGDTIEDRTVSFLELFYDLVYVVAVAGAASALAHHVTGPAVFEFGVVFGLIWIAWLNGTLYYDFHGREDIRTRFYTFVQMAILVLLSVYVGEAVHGGPGFALTYALFTLVLMYLWYSVYRVDQREGRLEMAASARRYLVLMAITVVSMAASAVADGQIRLVVWLGLIIMWLIFFIVAGRNTETNAEQSFFFDSTGERFGLLTIIVLGEVVVGVVEGLSESQRDPLTMVTAFFALIVGFGLWWNYFDWAGRHLPGQGRGGVFIWVVAHLPLTMSIAASGAAMVGIIEHATDGYTPATSSWLLTGAMALGFISMVVIIRSLKDYQRLRTVYNPIIIAMLLAAVVSLAIGYRQPAPLVLVASLVAVHSIVWSVGIWRLMVTDANLKE